MYTFLWAFSLLWIGLFLAEVIIFSHNYPTYFFKWETRFHSSKYSIISILTVFLECYFFIISLYELESSISLYIAYQFSITSVIMLNLSVKPVLSSRISSNFDIAVSSFVKSSYFENITHFFPNHFYFWNFKLISTLLPSLPSLQTLPYIPPQVPSNSWPLLSLIVIEWIYEYAYGFLSIICFSQFHLYVYFHKWLFESRQLISMLFPFVKKCVL